MAFARRSWDQLWVALRTSRPIAFGLHIAQMTGHPKAAIFLSQLVHWTRTGTRIHDTNGWVFKTYHEWRQETGLSRTELDTARRRLRMLGLIEEILAGRPATLWYRINLARFSQALEVCRKKALPESLTFAFMQTDERQIRDLLGPTTAYHRILAEVTGSINSALLLSRLLQLQKRALETRREWVTFTATQWRDDLALNRRALENARLRLCELELVDELRIHQGTPRILTQIRPRNVLEQLTQLAQAEQANAARTARATVAGLRKSSPPSYESAATDVRKLQSRSVRSESLDCSFRTHEVAGSVPARLQVSDISLVSTTTSTTTPPPLPTRERTDVDGARRPSVVVNGIDSEGDPQAELLWPDVLPAGMHAGAHQLLAGLEQSLAQTVLDEFAVRMRQGRVLRPLGYLRHLAEEAKQGTFIAEVAQAESERREKATAVQQALATATVAASGSPLLQQPYPFPSESDAHSKSVARAALAQLRQQLGSAR